MDRSALIVRYRAALIVFIVGLILSGLTAFPLSRELGFLSAMLGIAADAPMESLGGLRLWIATVRVGLERSYAAYPWIAYGTDWLGFAHVAIAIFFIGPLRDPTRNRWVLQAGVVCCALVLPVALIAGPLRGIPFYWRLLDCSFGIFGALPLLYCLRLSRSLEGGKDETP
ncbi:MAG: hypothetical protein A2X36_16845 [Elusimicrobia bacterium GWA2_69_24]|nr:MAG: hypothetical protein A2X36_16845 [Elusimicrobia bacterium GWA2_69_24]HBL16099.1 hypothetical protein [Elusimicrobiota bacterium]